MPISTYICQLKDLGDVIQKLFVDEFYISDSNSKILYQRVLLPFLNPIHDHTWYVIESPYVDKVYRDSYYHYFSSKAKTYAKDCIKISLFEQEVTAESFRRRDKIDLLQDIFWGFVILRPTEPKIIGRSVISPKALKNNDFSICYTTLPTTVNAIKLNANGFPHSSQDMETISCAETTLWSIMEYFGNKYSDYKPTLPFKITETLINVSAERLIPSKGLNIPQMGYALKQFGFGTRVYSKARFGDDFEGLLSCYVESGIPLIIAMENTASGGSIGHALLCIGHENITEKSIDTSGTANVSTSNIRIALNNKKVSLFDNDDIKKEFIFIDDNHPPYNRTTLDDPAKCYLPQFPAWNHCKITYFIVPLYQRVHLEAFEAKNFVLSLLSIGPFQLSDNKEVFLRTFLTSNRSFKNSIAINDDIPDDIKSLILETTMPKFIWVAELSTKDLIKAGKANGMIILDATESNNNFLKPLIMAFYENKMINFNALSAKFDKVDLPLPEFSIYLNNLKGF
jgi:hypothetical protein